MIEGILILIFAWSVGNVPSKRMVDVRAMLAALCKHYGEEQTLMLDYAGMSEQLRAQLRGNVATIVSADYECFYSDGRTLYCDTCCEYNCCETTTGTSSVYIGSGIAGSLIFIAFLIGCCIRRRRMIVRGQVLAQQPNRVVVVNRTICTARSAPGVAPVYNSNVPQTGSYTYEQMDVVGITPPPYTPRKDSSKADPPPPYSAC